MSVVEIKCKRCGETLTFRDNARGARSFMLVVDGGGRIVEACEGVRVLECSRQYVTGKLLPDILPLAKDADDVQALLPNPNESKSYQIKNNTLLLRDRKSPIESHIIPIKENGKQLYRIFSVIKET